MDNRTWFREAAYGMMAHFGLYSLLGGEYRGERVRTYAEWVQASCAIPNAEYEKLASVFNPIYFDADEWIKLAHDAGMKYFVFTAKHHDGFALYRSKADKFNVVDATPFGRDIVYELANACTKYGLKLGLYYSQELDWHHPHGGGYTNHVPCAGVSWDNNWDFPNDGTKDFSICFEEKIKPQVSEILTQYGDICLIWFDVPHTITPEQSLELNRLVKAHQPDCLINSRI
nr:alpha-L-fucosidase [Clostridia bacterium]